MSADNGIYIVEFSDGFRVTEAQAIENIDYYPEGSDERKQELKEYFEHSAIYKTLEDALLYAHKLEHEIAESDFPILEYGVSFLGKYEDFK